MYLSTPDVIALTIALTLSVTLITTTAVANARLTRKVQQLRKQLLSENKTPKAGK